MLPAGYRIGRYQIVRPLGRGGMGAVFLTHDPTLERFVAI
jgi:serine/threonine protein kinase